MSVYLPLVVDSTTGRIKVLPEGATLDPSAVFGQDYVYPYCSIDELVSHIGRPELELVLANKGLEFNLDDPDVSHVLLGVIWDAAGEINSHVGMVADLPLDQTPALLKGLNKKLAAYALQTEPSETQTENHKEHLTTLLRISKGQQDLGLPKSAEEKAGETAGNPASYTGRREFDDTAMEGF